ncbi:MAG TPA: hypothetical protein DDW52_03200, partial [Planctomycetaceae bacterium]|nr:hypothetical protein [Planctomycetaceae bacterium]
MSSYISIDWLPVNPMLCWLIVASVLHATWQCALLWLVYKCLCLLSPANSIHTRFRLAMGAMLVMGTLPFVNGCWLSYRANHPEAILSAAQSYSETGQLPLIAISEIKREKELQQPIGFRHATTESIAASPPPLGRQSLSTHSLPGPTSLAPDASPPPHLASNAVTGAVGSKGSFQIQWEVVLSVSVACIYILGLAAMLGRILTAVVRHWHLGNVVQKTDNQDSLPKKIRQIYDHAAKRVGNRLNVRLGAYRGKGIAIVVGVLRPTILFNVSVLTGLTPSQIEQVMIHELAHVYRWDPLTQLLQRLVESLLFFHPLVWTLSREVSELRERCCDDAVVQTYSRIEYAETLLSVSTVRPTASPLVLGVTGSSASGIHRRVLALLQETPRASHATSKRLAAVLSAGMLVTSLVCAMFYTSPISAPEPQLGSHATVVQVV